MKRYYAVLKTTIIKSKIIDAKSKKEVEELIRAGKINWRRGGMIDKEEELRVMKIVC